jgi:hypothetical protein
MANRTCALPECTHPHRARGLCSTHYNQQHQPHQHAAKPTTCAVCNLHILRPPRSRRRPTCSVNCRSVLQHGAAPLTSAYSWTQDAIVRARNAGATVIHTITRTEILERDDYCCYLCGKQTRTDVDCFHPDSPTVDHVVPLSRGGQHTLDNVRTACLRCNSVKGSDLIDHAA